MDIEEIIECADSITECYDELITKSAYYNLLGEGTHTVNGNKIVIDLYELKTLLYKTLMSVNILEGVRAIFFYKNTNIIRPCLFFQNLLCAWFHFFCLSFE